MTTVETHLAAGLGFQPGAVVRVVGYGGDADQVNIFDVHRVNPTVDVGRQKPGASFLARDAAARCAVRPPTKGNWVKLGVDGGGGVRTLRRASCFPWRLRPVCA